MGAMTVQLDFQDGSSWIDVSSLVIKSGFKRERKLFGNDFKCVQSTCQFRLMRDNIVINKLLTTTDDILARVYKDGNPYFYGFVRRNFNLQVRTRIDPLSVELIDRSEALKKKISSSFAWGGYKVHTAADLTHSVVHQLLLLAGYSAGEIMPGDDDIDKTVDYFVNIGFEDDRTYFDVLEKILFEYGYLFYHDESGNFRTYNFLPASLSSVIEFTSGTSGNMIGALRTKKQLWKYEASEIMWWLHETLTAATLFNDTTGGDSTMVCSIALASGEFYPEGAESAPVYTEYDVDGRDIIYCDSAVLDMAATGGIETTEFTSYFRRALLTIQNTGTAGAITRLKITGRAIVKGDIRKTRRYFVADTEKMRKYEAEYITDELDAVKLATGLSDYDNYSPFEYAFRSRTEAALGAIVDIVDTVNLGIDNQVRVKAVTDLEDLEYHDYICDGVTEYSAAECSSEFVHTQPPPPQPPTVNDINSSVFSAIITGFDDGGGTTIPTVPTIAYCKPAGPKAIGLKWDRQLNLTNFDRYEVRVSADESSWYDLSFDGTGAATGWGDELNQVTAWLTENLVQTEIPLAGTSSEPESVLLYYQVRRVTKASVASDWSSTAFNYAKPITPGMQAANSLFANNFIASEVETVLLRASTLYIGYAGTGTIDAPDEGDTLHVVTGVSDEYVEFTNGEWIVTANGIKLGGFVLGVLLNMIGCNGVYHPANPPASMERLPHNAFRVFNFENNYQDQNGLDAWATKSNLAFDSTTKKYGTYSLTATSGNQGDLYSPAGGTIGSSQAYGGWANITHSGTATGSASFMLFAAYTANDFIALSYHYTISSDICDLVLTVRKNGTYQFQDEHIVDVSTGWHSYYYVYESVTDKIYVIVDDDIYDMGVVGGTWGSGTFIYTLVRVRNNYLFGGITATEYVDELLFYWNKYLDPNLLAQHYTHGLAWATDWARNDIAIIPNTDGRVKCNGLLYAPAYNGATPTSMGLKPVDSAALTTAYQAIAHGLGVVPGREHLSIVCIIAEQSFSIGDEVVIPFSYEAGGNYYVYGLSKDAINYYIMRSTSVAVARKDTGATALLTLANWKWRIRCGV